ncbi:L-saccharopine oxidase 1 [Colletotrichum chlorophyti]|uniref:L-saccharopine oxidase 1 n=1 Tax=Colletotrichum chlorophyti TaxID=708187 RepID=A0A1Q8S454_9PEZI|nr:L-saccharopine oxidase 1 [Colletotrichum chlorophyti]
MAKPSVLIVGGGVFGTSTAYHLSLRGYEYVTVLDRFDAPSKDSAVTDLNKVVRADYPNPLYAKLGREAMQEWKSTASIFAGMYRNSGWIMAGKKLSRDWLNSASETAAQEGRDNVRFIAAGEMKTKWPALTGDFPSWTNLWGPDAGWVRYSDSPHRLRSLDELTCHFQVPSGQALLKMANAARGQGAKYICGEAGHVKKLLYNSKGTYNGAVSADGTAYQADIVILASGANTAALVESRQEVVAQTSVICVMRLEPHEIHKYKDIPIIDEFEQGIIFPPGENGFIKICSCRFLTNYYNGNIPGASILCSLGDHPGDGCPKEIEEEMRNFVREIIPDLADRPFISSKLYTRDGMAPDLNFRICPYPNTQNLYVATVGSNHGFKFLPIIGKYIADMIEGKLEKEWQDLWACKFGHVPNGSLNPHPWPVRDLSDLSGWEGRNAPGDDKLPWTWD